MLTAGKSALAIVSGGVILGLLLGSAANPVMKAPAEQWWQLSGRPEFSATPGYEWVEAGPEDLSPPDRYRPDLDYEALVTEDWTPPADWARYADDEWSGEEAAPARQDPVLEAASAAEQVAEAALAAETRPDSELSAEDTAPEPPLASAGSPAIW